MKPVGKFVVLYLDQKDASVIQGELDKKAQVCVLRERIIVFTATVFAVEGAEAWPGPPPAWRRRGVTEERCPARGSSTAGSGPPVGW